MVEQQLNQSGTQVIEMVADGSIGPVEPDNGGNWSKKFGVWVDNKFKDIVGRLKPEEQQMVETFANIALAAATVFNRQINDSESGLMWPQSILDPNGSDLLAHMIEQERENGTALGLADPYSTFGPSGFDWPARPYSSAYHEELAPLRKQLEILKNYPEANPYLDYIAALLATYEYDSTKDSDFHDMREADRAWVNISPSAPVLFMAEPTEVYLDPARATLSRDSRIAEWADQVEQSQGLPPWKTFMEFRLLVRDESMATADEIRAIRQKSRELFATSEDREVPVSLEFRRLLIASGNGAHPAKTAKNYPNQSDIRKQTGYKNVLCTNMIEMGTYNHLAPSLEKAFGDQIIDDMGIEQLIRGNTLRVVGHEENHPFKRFSDTAIEEMKATVNGIKAVIEAGFSQNDINASILSVIGSSLHTKAEVNKARRENDAVTERKYEAYYKADTMMMNYLWNKGAFVTNESGKAVRINFDKAKEAIIKLINDLDVVHSGNISESVPQFHQKYGNEKVWDNFTIH